MEISMVQQFAVVTIWIEKKKKRSGMLADVSLSG